MGSTAQMLIVIVVAALLCGGAWAGASPECMTQLLNASDCVTYVSSGSNLTKPELGCCPELAGLVEANPACLCYLLGGDISFGLQIDVKRALNLTSACSLSPLPLTSCSEIGIPVGAPRSSEQTGAPSSGATSQSAGTSIRVRGSSIAGSALAQLLILSIPIAFVLVKTF